MRILSLAGTRPEALKIAPILQVLSETPGVTSIIGTTGQHRSVVTRALKHFELTPDFELPSQRVGRGLDELLGKMLMHLGSKVRRIKPDWIVAVGDTTTVLAASLAAVHHQVRFAHVEAGLRSGCNTAPYPEELYRKLVSSVADLHLAPTPLARRNLRRENVPSDRIVVTGNSIIDAVRYFRHRPPPAGIGGLWRRLGLIKESSSKRRLVVTTFHRRENLGKPLQEYCAAMRELVQHFPDKLGVLCLVHPNPVVSELIKRELGGISQIVLSSPLAYPAFMAVLRRAYLVLTDSGGLEEEAAYLGVPVLVMRNHTERKEGVAAGVAKEVGVTRQGIVTAVKLLLDDPEEHQRMARGFRGYGRGRAAEHIVQALLRFSQPPAPSSS